MDMIVKKLLDGADQGKKSEEAHRRCVEAYEALGLSHKDALIAAACEARISAMNIDWAKFEF
jgi:hypothetical protein